jgi:translation initiation factor eIF-2B subunit delta
VVEQTLKKAYDEKKQFRVIVVDSRPKLEGAPPLCLRAPRHGRGCDSTPLAGKILLKRLSNYGIRCSYILVNAVSFVIKQVSKVFLGAHGMLANGYLVSRVGAEGEHCSHGAAPR